MKVVGIGDNVIDRYLNKGVMYPGGNAVNVAAHASMLGAQAAYVGELGDDLGGDIIGRALRGLGVDLSHAPVIPGATTKTCDVNVFDGERSEVGYDTGEHWAHKTSITSDDLAYMSGFDAVITSVNAKLQNDVHKLGVIPAIVVYDFSVKDKYRTDEYFDLVCPAVTLALFSCSDEPDDAVRELLRRAIDHGCAYALATRGARGPVLYDGSGYIDGPVSFVDAIDTMGAGDSYITAFVLSAIERGWRKDAPLDAASISRAMRDAASYSARNCMRPGGFGFEAPLADMKCSRQFEEMPA